MAQKPKKIYTLTPWGVALHVHVEKADVYKGNLKPGDKEPVPKFKIDIKPSDDDLEKFRKTMRKHADAMGFEGKKKVHLGIKMTEETEVESLCPSSQFKPAVFDSKNAPIGDEARIGPGSILRGYCEVSPYDKGLSLRLLSVQVKKLVQYGGGNESSPFEEEEEGYEGEGGSPFKDTPSEKPAPDEFDDIPF